MPARSADDRRHELGTAVAQERGQQVGAVGDVLLDAIDALRLDGDERSGQRCCRDR
jgi:hypothetical protein